MSLCDYPLDMQRLIYKLLKRNIIGNEDIDDSMLINYLYSQKYDEEFIKHLEHGMSNNE